MTIPYRICSKFHRQRYEWEHEPEELKQMFVNFSVADEELPPICLLDKNWEDIKLDLIEEYLKFSNQ